ncbi:MAG: hypothetical protein OXF88_02095 [Rhodobacteraceae bacterium]|nr:hypothetical protein [Paracoccaceae bacterium]MCY4140533.1 hypothetical protein [Paracoccaceae bacterium]
MIIETRPESELWMGPDDSAPLHLKHSNSPARAIELDLDSLHGAGFGFGFGFIEYPLAGFAAEHPKTVATIYTYETPSTNFGNPYDAVFIGVIGARKTKILKVIERALQYRHGVPDAVIKDYLSEESSGTRKVRIGDSPDSIRFESTQRVYHIEDRHLWAPFEKGRWYTDPEWTWALNPR